ncbi:polysaccharide deacetylase family protein [Microbulbifer marinus]|uniref:Polysaccharide deacetylase n=1 Tax=Microbulbifer marinus TaxID=658218 RepID=A0A1H3VK28_9GAMM|nr:polysaccharide deacetylase family protein [Microbulbifer marinus]SDZ75137.1 Polysaccharide deacetylase [Microbulbifer marinus]
MHDTTFSRPLTFAPMRLRRQVLAALQCGMALSGIGAAYVRMRGVSGAVILMYHGITDREDENWIDPRFAVPVSVFERQMRFLARHRRVISLDELLSLIAAGSSPPPGTVVITFDDGYRGVFTKAAPILKRYNLPATLYLATGQVTRVEAQWIDTLYSLFNARSCDLLHLAEENLGPVNLADPGNARASYLALADRLLPASQGQREKILTEIAQQLRPLRAPPPLTLSWEEVRQLRRLFPGIEIGVHTRDHIDLTACEPQVAVEEVAASVADVRQALDLVPKHFSFPYGRSNSAARSAVIAANLSSAAVTDPAVLVDSDGDPYAMPRLSAPSSMALFPFYTSGAYPQASLEVFGRA